MTALPHAFRLRASCLAGFLLAGINMAIAQPAQTAAERWLAKADLAPPFSAPATREAWEAKRQEIRAELWKLLGQLPPRPHPLRVETLAREDRGDYLLEKFQFDNEAGSEVRGYLLLPKGPPRKHPAILYCHWHAGEYDLGKEELFEAKHTPEAPGPAFARRGYVVIGIDASGFGERNGQGPDGPGERDYKAEETASKFDLWVGRTFWGMLLRDDLIALDYLASRPEVDAGRIGVTGMSMGSTRTWWLMALDDRLRVGVAIACMTRYENLIEHGHIFEHDIGYFVPGMLKHFDTEAVIALIAPRPILFQTGDRDGGSPVDGIHAIESAVRPVYRLYGRDDAFQNLIYPGQGHIYTPPMWAKTLAWMDAHLKPVAAP
ncbi:MAG TPA: alpha/beta hydrolase family protein [Opitutaceae bacterium]|jgi:dienelactone hydrolase|nr:alpha/beta hydrolase family protein [Opitutaceae bacterium]